MKKSVLLILAVVSLLSSEIASAVECGPIPTDGCIVTKNTVFNKNTYYFPNGIKIWNDSITLDCNDATLVGDESSSGIYVIGSIALGINKDVIVKNCNVREYTIGISFSFCKDCQALSNKIINNNYGIATQRDDSIVAHNIVKNNSFGIISANSKNNRIYNNTIELNHESALDIGDIKSSSITNNNIFNNGKGISSDLNCHNNTISNNSIINNGFDGIAVFGDDHLISNNKIINSSWRGIALFYSENSVIINNTIRENKLGGISFDHVKFTTIKNNNIINNSDGIVLGYSSSDNTIEFNNILDNEGYNLENNLVIGVNAEKNWWGTTVESEINESIYDYYDNDFFGIVDYKPWLSKPFDALYTKFSIDLSEGWNLISIPLNLTNNTLPAPFSSIEGNYSCVYAYKLNTWYSYCAGEPSSPYNYLTPATAFWINMINDDVLEVKGYEVHNITGDLGTGWSLMGYPYLEEKNISEFFDNATVYMYNNSEWYSYNSNKSSELNTLNKFIPGCGYWIKNEE